MLVGVIDHYQKMIINYYNDCEYICNNYNSYFIRCSDCLLNYYLFASYDMPLEYIDEIIDNASYIKDYELKINNLYIKINSGYFI